MTAADGSIPRVSVAMATHAGAPFIAEQLRSILTQSRPIDELVVVDDASPDDTVAIVERTIAEHAATGAALDVVLLRNDRPLGVTANFERALRAATGEIVALSDQDDRWAADRIERALVELERRPAAELVASDARLVDADGVDGGVRLFAALGIDAARLDAVAGERAVDELLRRNLFTGATMLVRRGLIERSAPFPESWVHDEWLAIAAALGGGIAVVRDPLIDYRQHGGNQIGAAELGVRARIDRLRAPRAARNARLLARAEALAARASELRLERPDVPDSRFADKVAHERARSALPVRRLARVRGVWRLWRSGGYRRFGGGAQDALRDLVQPA
ncbi:glycosyltransferase family 2 protein [Agromyces seonyuensis]|uniref:Glycosyltransferase n=1 Tax=Agromyces seonyuensis TaxID=2662446 RepID=A0A6I4P265_9MICO|nr:glycosyltransferase family 2 protein [Agromyces seonyuensis]MWB98845.1 glycosyltransferase [Agromyces seonyuensis]